MSLDINFVAPEGERLGSAAEILAALRDLLPEAWFEEGEAPWGGLSLLGVGEIRVFLLMADPPGEGVEEVTFSVQPEADPEVDAAHPLWELVRAVSRATGWATELGAVPFDPEHPPSRAPKRRWWSIGR